MELYDEINRWREEYYYKLQGCKNALIDNYALSHAYNDRSLNEFMEQLIEKHGLEYVTLLLSNIIRESAWDGRYSSDVKVWVNRCPEIRQPPGERKEPMQFSALHLDVYPVILNQTARIAMQKEKDLSHTNRKEPER